jgi:hypothetical protein
VPAGSLAPTRSHSRESGNPCCYSPQTQTPTVAGVARCSAMLPRESQCWPETPEVTPDLIRGPTPLGQAHQCWTKPEDFRVGPGLAGVTVRGGMSAKRLLTLLSIPRSSSSGLTRGGCTLGRSGKCRALGSSPRVTSGGEDGGSSRRESSGAATAWAVECLWQCSLRSLHSYCFPTPHVILGPDPRRLYFGMDRQVQCPRVKPEGDGWWGGMRRGWNPRWRASRAE